MPKPEYRIQNPDLHLRESLVPWQCPDYTHSAGVAVIEPFKKGMISILVQLEEKNYIKSNTIYILIP